MPKMLWDLQRAFASISPDEPNETRPAKPASRFAQHGKRSAGMSVDGELGRREKALPMVETPTLGQHGQCSREKAARMYRSACRAGMEGVWEDCSNVGMQ